MALQREKSIENIPPLTIRQLQVIALIGRGFTAKQIAKSLGVSVYTAAAHRRQIVLRVGAASLAEAVAICLRRGELEFGPEGLRVTEFARASADERGDTESAPQWRPVRKPK